MTHKLGKRQEAILASLRQHRYWSPGCGWFWGSYSATVRLLDSLLARGLAVRDTTTVGGQQIVRYRPVELAGKPVVDGNDNLYVLISDAADKLVDLMREAETRGLKLGDRPMQVYGDVLALSETVTNALREGK